MRTNKYIVVIIVMIFSSLSVYAQSDYAKFLMNTKYQQVNLKDIETNVVTPGSPYLYQDLFSRYEKNDTTLNLDDYRNLYYGYMYQESYEPHIESPYIDSLSVLLNNDGAIFKYESSMKAIYYLEKILNERPFSLKFLNIMTYIYGVKLKSEKFSKIYSYKFEMVLRAIFSSGTGLNKDKPWRVTNRGDAQSVLNFLGVEVTKRIYVTAICEYYLIREKQGNAKGYYFDFEPIYTRSLLPKGKRKIELNPTSNPKSDRYINMRKTVI